MLDILISYINLIIISLRYIVKLTAFLPPNPKGFRIKNSKNEIKKGDNNLILNKDDILELLLLLPNKSKSQKDSNSQEKKSKEKNDEIIIIKNQYYKYDPVTREDVSYLLLNIKNEDNNTIIPAFLFKSNKIDENNNINNYIVIYCHGNSGDIGTTFYQCHSLSKKLMCNVLSFEYPGYGYSTDKDNINEKRAYFYIRQVYNYTRNELKFNPEDIIIFGFSLGTGIAFDLVCDKNYPNGGVILQCAFLSILRTIYNFKKTYYFDLFNNCDKAKFCNSKIYFIHGNKDKIVPYIHGRILSQIIPKEFFCGFFTVEGADHHDILKYGRNEYYEKINNFINSLRENREKKEDEKSSEQNNTIIKNFDDTAFSKEFKKKIILDVSDNTTTRDLLFSYEKHKDNLPPLIIKKLNEIYNDQKSDIKNNNNNNIKNENT